jgi:MFS family permease
MRRLALLAVLTYPLAFRRRYGDEMRALLDDEPPRSRTVLDLLRGALAAHLRPPAGLGGVVELDDRLRASMSGVLACWVAFAAAGSGFAITTEDVPFSKAGNGHPLLGSAHGAIQILAIVASVAVVAGALPLVLAALARARHERRLRLLVSLPVAAVITFAGLTAVLVWVAHGQRSHHATTGSGIAFIAWALAGLACAAVCVIASRRVLFLMPVARRRLFMAFGCAAIITTAMVVIAMFTALYAIALSVDVPGLAASGNGPLHPTSVTISLVLQLVVMLVAASLAVTTTRRGWRAVAPRTARS